MYYTRAIQIQAVLFLLVIVAGFGFVVARFATPAGRAGFSTIGWTEVADGAFTKSVDAVVVAALPKSDPLDGLQAGLEYRVLDDAGPQVRAGCFGWLFLGEEVWEVKDGERNMAQHLAIAKKIVAAFAHRHIGLVMVTVPDKARVASADLCAQRVAPQAQGRLALWTRLVAGVPVAKVDIVDGWPGKPGYWRTDTHWDRTGARFAATRTAEVVERILGGRGNQGATVTRAPEQIRPGDLMHLSNLQNAPRALQPPPDMERPETVAWQTSGGLLDTGPAPDVILTGSSYSRNSGFADVLGLALGREVVQLSEDGGGFDGAMLALFAQHRKTLAQAKVVVWEFPERSLTQPLSDDERAYLNAPAKTDP